MAHTRGIEHLPRDTLSEILTRVAGSSGGATDIARAFSVSKTLRTFVTDENVLRAVSFEDLLQCLNGRYLLLSDVEGLLARCSRAGNSNAQLILAKVILVSATAMCNAKDTSGCYQVTDNYTLSDLDKAARLLNHFSAENTDDPSELLLLVRNFLCRAEVRDLIRMEFHFKKFATWFLVHGNKSRYEQFLITFASLRHPSPGSFVEDFNEFCILVHNKMKEFGVDEELISPLLECLVELNDDVMYETMIERVGIAMSIFNEGWKVASTVASTQYNINEMRWFNSTAFRTARMLRGYLEDCVDREDLVLSSRGLLLASFDALFNLQQGMTIDLDQVKIFEMEFYESDSPPMSPKLGCLRVDSP